MKTNTAQIIKGHTCVQHVTRPAGAAVPAMVLINVMSVKVGTENKRVQRTVSVSRLRGNSVHVRLLFLITDYHSTSNRYR